MNDVHPRINKAYRQMKQHLEGGILPFWMENGLDRDHEGYLMCFDAEGRATDNTDKYLVTQTRMIWGMSASFVAGAIVGGLVSLAPIGPRSKSRTDVSEKKP